MLRLAVFATLLAIAFASSSPSCPQFYSPGSNGFCYRYMKAGKTFKAAAQRCASDRAHLTSIQNAFGNNIVHGVTSDTPAWIGLTCTGGSNTNCAWDDGTSFGSYTNFGAASGNSTATCVYMGPDGNWDFDNCDTVKPYVCGIPDNHSPPCYGYTMGGAYCFKPDYSLAGFTEAQKVCKAECGDLAYIPNKQENDKIVAGLCWECDNVNVLAKIGLTLNDDTYTWTNGKPFNPNTDYSNFAFVRPSLGNCVAIAVADTTVSGKHVLRGQWVNVNCVQYGPYVCQRPPNTQCTN